MKIQSLFSLIIIILLISTKAEAQLFDRLKKRTKEKLERKAEEKLVEEISEEIARRAFKPIDKAMDEMLRSSYEEQEGEEVDWEKAGAAYSDFLSGMNKAADVPPTFSFDMILDIEVKDGKNDKYKMEYYLSKNEPVMGIRQMDNKNQFMIFDAGRDLMIMYTDDGNKKTAQAIPSMLKIATVLAKSESSDYDKQEIKIEKTGKTKKIAGYNCEEYKIESEEEKIKTYIAPNFPVSIHDTFGQMMEKFIPENYKKASEAVNGMMMKSIYESKEKDEYDSEWEVKKVKEKSWTITNAQYGLESRTE